MRAILQQVACAEGQELTSKEYKTQVGSQSGVGQAAAKNQLIANADLSPIIHNANDYLLSETRSEACLPIAIEDKVLGVLEAQSINSNAFDPILLASLQTIANHLAPAIQHFQARETTQTILGELSLLYQSSQSMAQAKTNDEILKQTAKTLRQAPFMTYVLKADDNRLRLISNHDPESTEVATPPLPELFDISPVEIEHFLFIHEYLITYELSPATGMPESLRNLAKQLGCTAAAFIPIRRSNQLEALIVLGAKRGDDLNHKTLQLYVSLANLTSVALERVLALENTERRLNRLQILDSVSQAITVETDLNHLFRVIHEQITQVMGEIDFMIAMYDPKANTIDVPYAYEENQPISIPSFGLGDGLTSILIRSKQPLLLVEDTEKRAIELGARLMGKPAKSWLGVPLIVGGEAIGAIIVQDLEREHRFDEDDQRLLSTLATQVAGSVRNTRLIHETRLLAERESAAKEITNKLWKSSDIDTVLRTAIYELGKSLNATTGFVQLELDEREGNIN